MITYTNLLILLGTWTACAFVLGVFVGRFIKVGSSDPVRRVEDFETRREQLRATFAGRRVH